MINSDRLYEIMRYIVNGILATAVHYGIFLFSLSFITPFSAGISNFIASFVGIMISFMGNRYFVFCSWNAPLGPQFIRFSALYFGIAVVNGMTLTIWTDFWGLDKSIGFLVALIIQVVLSYLGGKRLVFA